MMDKTFDNFMSPEDSGKQDHIISHTSVQNRRENCHYKFPVNGPNSVSRSINNSNKGEHFRILLNHHKLSEKHTLSHHNKILTGHQAERQKIRFPPPTAAFLPRTNFNRFPGPSATFVPRTNFNRFPGPSATFVPRTNYNRFPALSPDIEQSRNDNWTPTIRTAVDNFVSPSNPVRKTNSAKDRMVTPDNFSRTMKTPSRRLHDKRLRPYALPEKRRNKINIVVDRNQFDDVETEALLAGDQDFCIRYIMPILEKLCHERKMLAFLNIQAVLHNCEFETAIRTWNLTQFIEATPVPHFPTQSAPVKVEMFCLNVILPIFSRLPERNVRVRTDFSPD